jgi:hypothetical protein
VWEIDNASIQSDVDDRLEEGRGNLDKVSPKLPAAARQLNEPAVRELLE